MKPSSRTKSRAARSAEPAEPPASPVAVAEPARPALAEAASPAGPDSSAAADAAPAPESAAPKTSLPPAPSPLRPFAPNPAWEYTPSPDNAAAEPGDPLREPPFLPSVAAVLRSVRLRHWLVVTILFFALSVRRDAARAGLPYAIHWDEPFIVQPALRALRHGTYMPDRFDYGPANIYVHAAWGVAGFMGGVGDGRFPDSIYGLKTDRETGWLWSVPSPYMWHHARLLSVALGVLTVFLTYRAGAATGSHGAGLVAAAVVAGNSTAIWQTSHVTADSTTCACAAAALWASIALLRSRPLWAYHAAAMAAGAAAAFKYTSLVFVAVPLAAHALSVKPPRRTFFPGRLFAGTAAATALVLVMMLPAFAEPAKFLHDQNAAQEFYKQAPIGAFGKVASVAKRTLALLDAGSIQGPAPSAPGAVTALPPYAPGAAGLPLVAAAVLGAVFLGSTRPRLLALLLLPVAAMHLIIGPATVFFYMRYLLPALPPLALLAGFGALRAADLAGRWIWPGDTASRLRHGPAVACAAATLAVLPPVWQNAADARAAGVRPDSRVALSKSMLAAFPAGSRIAIMGETRWSPSAEERAKFKITGANIPRSLFAPPDPAKVDYIVMPKAISYEAPVDPRHARHGDRLNAWLRRGGALLDAGSNPMVLGNVLTKDLAVRVVRNTPAFAATWKPEPPVDIVTGPAFDTSPPAAEGQLLSNRGVALRPGVQVTAPLRLTTATATLYLRARGMSPYRQSVQPSVSCDIGGSTDTAVRKPFVHLNFNIERSQGGISEYDAALPRPLPPGDYMVALKGADPDGLLVIVDWLRAPAAK